MPLLGPMGSLTASFIPAGRLRKTPFSPRASSFQIGPRRQGYASPLRALDGSGPIRRDDCLRGERGGADQTVFVSHLIAFDSIAPRPKSGVFGPCGRAERGSALELVGRVSLFQGSFSPVAGFGDQMPGLLVGVAAVAEKLRYAADVPGSEYSFSLPGLIS